MGLARSIRLRHCRGALLAIFLALPTDILAQQQPPINTRIPPPPPPPELPAPRAPSPAPAPPVVPTAVVPPSTPTSVSHPAGATPAATLPRHVPAKIVVPSGTRIAVVLDTPLSTRISRTGQLVNFRTSEALPVGPDLAIPPDSIFSGKVTEASRPRSFGKSGQLRVKVDHFSLADGTGSDVVARLESSDPDQSGRKPSDHSPGANIYNLAIWTAQGTLLGAQIHGGKGAAVGAGAGATVALIVLMSRHGQDVYLEPGMPFLVTLDRPLSLPGPAVAAIQPAASSSVNASGQPTSIRPGVPQATSHDDSPNGTASADPSTDSDRPQLKHRPKPPQP